MIFFLSIGGFSPLTLIDLFYVFYFYTSFLHIFLLSCISLDSENFCAEFESYILIFISQLSFPTTRCNYVSQ